MSLGRRTTKGIVGFLVIASGAISAFAQNSVIVANPQVADATIDQAAIKNIFLGRKKAWEDGARITLATLSVQATKSDFLKQYVGKTVSQFDTYWKRLVFSGKAPLPKMFESEEELLAFVAKTAGAIGYISNARTTSGEDVDGCRIIKVE